MIEKRITQHHLEAGEIALTELEQADLSLPEHSTTIDIELESEPFKAQWSGRSRHLTGDVLAERLQDYGQVGGLLRVRLVDEVYRLTLLPPGTQLQIRQTYVPPTVSRKSDTAKRAIKRRATVDRQFHADSEYDWGASSKNGTGFLVDARKMLGEQIKAGGWDTRDLVELRLQGEELATLDDFEELLAVDVANVDRMPHQEAAARHALSRLRGRAILADEVGLGKTIEAGLAVKELTLRGLATRVLILCPAPLREQWREEMNAKFDIPFEVAYRGSEIGKQDKLALSLTLATSNIDALTKKPWDIIIVDEAHRAAGAGARRRRELITALTTACRYAFFLTATPVQNDLLELYRLVELLRPGTFTSVSQFRSQYMTRTDPRTPNDPAALRRLISSAMIRTTRAQAGVDRVVRRAEDVPVELGSAEKELYLLSTDLLRRVMKDSSDTMRRRSLALRLTASPFSMGTTALRMAERHGDERVRKVLNEIGHMAMDITGSARENTAMSITKQWVKEHGRVLIFTQHTDTVTGLLRRMAADGLAARAFHGSMSPTERASTISAFRSGEAPVMISTDAGAEGQNLQFCNCVVNYDLPWNPMRIEQRIGRVDRLTQPRDEVHIANLYARGTIDENVYKLLAEKLRMFELLFGQVTTILGELDDAKSASFETRVMEALFAESDSKMGALLGTLGTELADARERASTLIAADSGMSSWMATAFEHRKDLTKAGATELAPEVIERARMRQRRVQTWVRAVLGALDAQVIHDTGDGEGAFLTVQLDEELADELGGRTVLHLAFDRLGMEHHADAELCAVGSPVFDELLGLLRMRGDLHATIPVVPDDPGPSPYKHSTSTTLLRRRLIPSGKWSGQATFRATVGEAETTDHIITADISGESEIRLPRKPLADGESLPSTFGVPAKVIAEFERRAATQLEGLRRDRAKQIERDQAAEWTRVLSGYTAQIEEASPEDRARLRRAMASEEKRLSRGTDVRARAKLLAVTLDENDWVVEETWAGPGGAEARLTYEWGRDAPPVIASEVTGSPIQVLAVCSSGHKIDDADRKHCASCDLDRCDECGPDATMSDCPVCGIDCCGVCRLETGGLCVRCASPERAADLDRGFSIAWRVNAGMILHVGQRHAELANADGATACFIVPDADVTDPDRIRARSYAFANGLPIDSGVALRALDAHPAPNHADTVVIRSTSVVDNELSLSPTGSSEIDGAAVRQLPNTPPCDVRSESDFALDLYLPGLREDAPPPAPPSTRVTRRAQFTDLVLDADRLAEVVSTVSDDGSLSGVEQQSAQLNWNPHVLEDATLATAELCNVRVVVARRNEAVLVTATSTITAKADHWIALPEGASRDLQLDWFDVLDGAGTPGGRIGQRTDEATEIRGSFPNPSECHLVDRTIDDVVEIADVFDGVALQPADESLLPPDEMIRRDGRVAMSPLPDELGRVLLDRAQRSFTKVAMSGFEVHESWSGHGTAVHRYEAFDGLPLLPRLADIDARAGDFGVCRDGHFYATSTAARCAACDTWACRACDDVAHQASTACESCSAQVCRRCLTTEHAVSSAACFSCGEKACGECGRDPHVIGCAVCTRQVCAGCRTLTTCSACASLEPASDDLIASAPAELALAGAGVLAASDADATVLVFNRGNAIEHAVVRDGLVDRWVVFDRAHITPLYAVRIAASMKLGKQIIPAQRSAAPDSAATYPHVVLESERAYKCEWSVPDSDEIGMGAATFADRKSDIATAVLDTFPELMRTPDPITAAPTELRQVLTRIPVPLTTPFKMRWRTVGRDVLLVGSGLVIRELDGPDVTEERIAWGGGTEENSLSEYWQPLPTVRAVAIADGTKAVAVSMASLLAVGVQTARHTTWYSVVTSSQAPAATTMARRAGLADADEVSVYTHPSRIIRSKVLNAVDIGVTAQPVLEHGTVSPNSAATSATNDALAAWYADAQIRVPTLNSVSDKLRLDIVQALDHHPDRTALRIGAIVEEVAKTDTGQVWQFDVMLSPGELDARRFDSKTMSHRGSGVLDREGHFGGDDMRCPYCTARLCGLCTKGMTACDCCGIALCMLCVHEPHQNLWLCPACAGVRPPSRAEARQHGRLMFTRGMLIGSDDKHVIVVEQSKKTWVRHGGDDEKHPLASPSLLGFLNERASLKAAD